MTTNSPSKESSLAQGKTHASRLYNVAEDPMGSMISASVAVIASFGLVLSGIWIINVGLN